MALRVLSIDAVFVEAGTEFTAAALAQHAAYEATLAVSAIPHEHMDVHEKKDCVGAVAGGFVAGSARMEMAQGDTDEESTEHKLASIRRAVTGVGIAIKGVAAHREFRYANENFGFDRFAAKASAALTAA